MRLLAVDYGAFTGALLGAAGTITAGYLAWIGAERQIGEQRQANYVSERAQFLDEEDKIEKRLSAYHMASPIVIRASGLLDLALARARHEHVKEVESYPNLTAYSRMRDGGAIFENSLSQIAVIGQLDPYLGVTLSRTFTYSAEMRSKCLKEATDADAKRDCEVSLERMRNLLSTVETSIQLHITSLGDRLDFVKRRKMELESKF